MKIDLKQQMEKAHEFKGLAFALAEGTMLTGTETDDEIENVTFFVSTLMAVGARAKRNEHIATGIMIGAGLSALTLGVVASLQNTEEDEEPEEV